MVLTHAVLFLVGLIGATEGNVCCFPRQYQATQRLVKTTFTHGHVSVMTGTLQYWKDGDSKRETFIEKLNVDGHDTSVTVIIDQNITMTKYVIYDGHCSKKTPGHWKDGCVQDWSSLLEDSYFGQPNSGMTFKNYDNSQGSAKSYLTVTDDCFPMFDVSVVPTGGSPYMQAVQLHNFTTTIDDRSVFDIPKICHDNNIVG